MTSSRTSLLYDLLASLNTRSWFTRTETGATCSIDTIRRKSRELLRSRGEASGIAVASDILASIDACEGLKARDLLQTLAEDFGADRQSLRQAAERYAAEPSATTLEDLQRHAEAPRQELLRRLNRAPGGTAALVRLREKLLPFVKDDPELFGPVDADFLHLFQSWFNRGFLVLRTIDWNTPASILEKIIEYEAVHAIDSWDALRERLAPPDRRCYAFFHPAIPDDPLIFVEVALTSDIPASIRAVLSDERTVMRPEDAQTAVFYSISNCHKGLAGVSFGSFLIKQVAADLQESLPNLKTFVTLSPVPGLRRWLDGLDWSRLLPAERDALEQLDRGGPSGDEAGLPANVRTGLLSLTARYFLAEKRPDGQPVDPVARFHLGNGAQLNRIMASADLSATGLRQSHGVMVNYLYDLPKVEQRHEAYFASSQIAASRAVTSLLPSRDGAEKLRVIA